MPPFFLDYCMKNRPLPQATQVDIWGFGLCKGVFAHGVSGQGLWVDMGAEPASLLGRKKAMDKGKGEHGGTAPIPPHLVMG